MLAKAVRFVRLPLVFISIWAVARFIMGLAGVPYAPRGNAVFSVVMMTTISSLYFGALSARIGNFNWLGTALVGATMAVYAQILILLATIISVAGGLETYFVHWDALNLPMDSPPITMGQAFAIRLPGLVINTILAALFAIIGRLFAGLAPRQA